MLAYVELQADRCPGCGGWLSETTKADGHGYHNHVQVCFKCKATALWQRDTAAKDEAFKRVPEDQRAENGYVGPEGRLHTSWRIPPPDDDD